MNSVCTCWLHARQHASQNKIMLWSKPSGIHNLGKGHAQFLHPHPNHLAKPPGGNPSIYCLHPHPSCWALWENHQCVEDAPAKSETTEAVGDKVSIFGSFTESSDLHSCFPDPFSQLFLFFSKAKSSTCVQNHFFSCLLGGLFHQFYLHFLVSSKVSTGSF